MKPVLKGTQRFASCAERHALARLKCVAAAPEGDRLRSALSNS